MRQRWRSNVNSALYGSLCRRFAIVWGKDHKMQGVPLLSYYSMIQSVFISLFCCFWFLTFVESKYYSLNSAALNSGLSFKSIKRVDCDGGVREEPHKVRIKIKKCRFLLLASEMRIMLSGKHGKANCSICNWRRLFCKSISLWTIMDSKYYLIFLVRLYLIFFFKIIHQVLEINISKIEQALYVGLKAK